MKRIILISGTHGCGKTTFTNDLKRAAPNLIEVVDVKFSRKIQEEGGYTFADLMYDADLFDLHQRKVFALFQEVVAQCIQESHKNNKVYVIERGYVDIHAYNVVVNKRYFRRGYQYLGTLPEDTFPEICNVYLSPTGVPFEFDEQRGSEDIRAQVDEYIFQEMKNLEKARNIDTLFINDTDRDIRVAKMLQHILGNEEVITPRVEEKRDNILLETVTGKFVDVMNPKPEQIVFDDIAWHLSRISRFCGATITEVPYSVGQHSIFVCREFLKLCKTFVTSDEYTEADILAGAIMALLHDGAEAYTGDLPSPYKQHPKLRPVFKEIEEKLDRCILHNFATVPSNAEWIHTTIKQADMIARKIEAHAFMQSRGAGWAGLPMVSLLELQSFSSPKPSAIVYEDFVKVYDGLSGEQVIDKYENLGTFIDYLLAKFFTDLRVFEK